MKEKVYFIDDSEIADIIKDKEKEGKALVEVCNHIDGNYCIFDDGKPLTLEQRVQVIEDLLKITY